MKTEEKIKVYLVDDHQMLKDGLEALLDGEQNLMVVGQASSGEEALKEIQEREVDVIIMDIGLEGMSGLETIKLIRKLGLTTKIIVLSMHSDQEIISQVFKVGSNGFVPKSTAHDNLLTAIRSVSKGEKYLHPGTAAEAIQRMSQQHTASLQLGDLSNRELEVFTLTAMGYTRTEISEQLNIKPKTVDTYRSRAMQKLDLHSRAGLVEFAVSTGILSHD